MKEDPTINYAFALKHGIVRDEMRLNPNTAKSV